MPRTRRKHNTRLFTLHSVKGGVGKTSLALAIASWCASHFKEETHLVDADMTGTNILDCFFPEENLLAELYLNDFLLATPDRYLGFLGRKNTALTQTEFVNVPDGPKGLKIFPSRSDLDSIRKIVPFLSQEWHLHFFQERLSDLVHALDGTFPNIIIDFPPGLFGFSLAGFKVGQDILRKMEKEVESDGRTTVLPILVSSGDSVDYCSAIPMLDGILSEIDSGKEKLGKQVRIVFNRFVFPKGQSKDPVNEMARIVKILKTRGKSNDFGIDLIEKGAKSGETRATILPRIDDFMMHDVPRIMNDICSKKNNQRETGDPRNKLKLAPAMEEWVLEVKKWLPE